jgi:hypothetical protein
MSNAHKLILSVTGAVMIMVVVIGGLVVARNVQQHLSPGPQLVASAPTDSPEPIVTFAPPPPVPSAEVVAQRLHCTRFLNIAVGGGVKGIVLDEGSCYIHGVKYAIDTFQNPKVRDTWLRMSEPMGVVPAFETNTSVTYKSVTG